MVSKEIITNVLSDSAQQKTNVNNVIFPSQSLAAPGTNFSAKDRRQDFEEVIMFEHLRQQ